MLSTIQRIRFEELTVYGQKNAKCAGGCGRRLKRTKKFWQTLSPFNKNTGGQPRTRDEIYRELRGERIAWEKEPETCKRCASQ